MTTRQLATKTVLQRAALDALVKLDPRHQLGNPVMFVVWVGSMLTTALWLVALLGHVDAHRGFAAAICGWLWATVLFANFAEAVAEGRGKAQAEALRRTRTQTRARRLRDPARHEDVEIVSGGELRRGDVVLVQAGELIPADGEVVAGVASVNESAVTGESAPVIRESGGDRSAVTGGTTVLSDWLVIRVAANAGESFLDRMIGLVEAARRRRTPNEIALAILLAALALVFLVVTATIRPFR
jgi:K+-transporting ATPase ATPase B chain